MAARLLDVPEVDARLPEIITAYRAMYAMAADEGYGYSLELIGYSRRDGFRLAAAFDDDDDRVLGFGLGFTGLAGQIWTDSLAAAMDPGVSNEWLGGHFEFAQFGVVPDMRRRGVATDVYEVLFADLPHDRGILTVIETNVPARTFYEAHGWTTVHRDFYSPSGLGPYRVMGKQLHGAAV
ncbi:MAG: GNAT family N-acetyltransferase [Acidimicrobiia bacterium]|nr:GNAT family N-acetyltransferase [Acidimicrobiia bacterium]